MGDEFVVVVTHDHMCKKCISLLTRIDKLENDLPPDLIVKGVVVRKEPDKEQTK